MQWLIIIKKISEHNGFIDTIIVRFKVSNIQTNMQKIKIMILNFDIHKLVVLHPKVLNECKCEEKYFVLKPYKFYFMSSSLRNIRGF